MPEQFQHLTDLILRNWQGEATETEQDELERWLNAHPDNRLLFEQFDKPDWVNEEYESYNSIDPEPALQKLSQKIDQYEESKMAGDGHADETGIDQNRKPKTIRRVLIYGLGAIAAAIIVIVMINRNEQQPSQPKSVPAGEVAQTDSAATPQPGSDKAVLTLPDGRNYVLQNEPNSKLAEYGNNIFIKRGGLVSVGRSPDSNANSPINYFTLSVPRNGQYRLLLADGSWAWLNSESSIRFPSRDTGHIRQVSITGEVYFEVKSDRSNPFTVWVGETKTVAFGTHFNINAYNDEGKTKATLLEGKLQVIYKNEQVLLTPSKSAVIKEGKKIEVKTEPTPENIVSWKDGDFKFEDDSLTTVVRQLARWYDLKVVYITKPTALVSYSGLRSNSIKNIIEGLKIGNSEIHIEISNDSLIVNK
jgi:transmembrane sensor